MRVMFMINFKPNWKRLIILGTIERENVQVLSHGGADSADGVSKTGGHEERKKLHH